MKEKTCCFTGHRNIPSEQLKVIAQRLEKVVVESIEQGYRYFGAGGARGYDLLASKTILKLKSRYPHIRLILVLPCYSLTRDWKHTDIVEYERILKKADKVVYTSKEYTPDCMFKRNRHLVDNSSLCICYLTESKGGTCYTVNYAKRKGLKIVNIGKYIDHVSR